MIETKLLAPGVTLRCFRDFRFKHGRISFQFIRPMNVQEAHLNALLPDVLLQGTADHPSLRAINQHLDSLYGVGVGALVRRIGDYHTLGFGFTFLEDRFVMDGTQVLTGVLAFLTELLTRPLVQDGTFQEAIVEVEKTNLIAAIDGEYNNKQVFALGRLLKTMCRADTFGLPRLGEPEDIERITPRQLYSHFLKVRRESPVEIFYVGTEAPSKISELLAPLLSAWDRDPLTLPPQTGLRAASGREETETADITQGKLCLGFVTPITHREPEFAAMKVLSTLLGGGMNSKLFQNVRERLSLCYSIGATYYSTKGILTVCAGIDFDKKDTAQAEILRQLEACRLGSITREELDSAKAALISSLRATHDSTGAIEGYYAVNALFGLDMTPEVYMHTLQQVTLEQVVAAANTLQLHSIYFLKGEIQ